MAESDAIEYTRSAHKYEALPEAERFISAGTFGWVKKVRTISDGKVRKYDQPSRKSSAIGL